MGKCLRYWSKRSAGSIENEVAERMAKGMLSKENEEIERSSKYSTR